MENKDFGKMMLKIGMRTGNREQRVKERSDGYAVK